MFPKHWLRDLHKRILGPTRSDRQRVSRRSYRARLRQAGVRLSPALEQLEERALLAPVTVTITRIEELVNPDAELFDDTPGDYYARVRIGDQFEKTTEPLSHDPAFNEAHPVFPGYTIEPYWIFSTDVDPNNGPVRVQIDLYDYDSVDDDHVDISPVRDQKQLILFVDPLTGTWVGDVPPNQGFARGNGDDDSEGRGLISFAISTLSDDGDLDGDGLLDSWELFGLDYNGDSDMEGGPPPLDLPGLGADPRHKDLFLEIDYMPGRAIPRDELDAVKAAFSVAPKTAGVNAHELPFGADAKVNPDDQPGINLHIDTLNGNFQTGGTQVDTANISNFTSLYKSLKTKEFTDQDPDRRPVFRYALSAAPPTNLTGFSNPGAGYENGSKTLVDLTKSWVRNEWSDFKTVGGDITVTITGGPGSGQVRKIVSNTENTLVVEKEWDTIPTSASQYAIQWSVGGWGRSGTDLIVFQTDGATLMHELGHTMNLDHGGGDGNNLKPNYISVMNYDHGFGISEALSGSLAGSLPSILDYSPARMTTTGLSSGPNSMTTLDDSKAMWTAGQWAGGFVEIVDSNGNNRQVRQIMSNTPNQLVIGNSWTMTPDNTWVYSLYSADPTRALAPLPSLDESNLDETFILDSSDSSHVMWFRDTTGNKIPWTPTANAHSG
jgi:hypothetical protein